MIGFLSFILLVGSAACSSGDWRLVESVQKHEASLEACGSLLGAHLGSVKSCATLAADVANLKTFLETVATEGESLASEGEALLVKYNKCATESILKKIACYESCLTEAKALAATAQDDEQEFLSEGTTLMTKIESDIATCFSTGLSKTRFEAKMALCKLRM